MSTSTNSVLKNALERLEDTLTSPVLRQNSYQDLQNALNTAEAIDKEIAKRLLGVCIHDLNEDIKYATNASTIIGALLVKIKKGQCPITPTLEVSAISVISLLKTIASSNQFVALKGILFNTLLSYPDNTLICVNGENTDKIIELLNAYIIAGNKVVPITFLTTLFKILPHANKTTFVKESLELWFSKVIPFLMGCIQTELHVMSCVELLEGLTEVLVDIEYAENSHWKVLIECIYNPNKYPSIMKSILENRSDFWHRLWIVFVKLLKDQITKVSNSSGSPINSMLPVVEAAFKMDPLNRCKAFQCWSVLVDNFSRESNEAYVNKRLKLLLIPLKSSNAKVEETAISKFNTWWHLILRFHNKMEGLTDMILIPFFQFCFGKRAAKSPVAPGQFSDTLKKLSLQAFVEIVGHVNCEGCVHIPKLKTRLISTKILVDYWNDWISFFKVAVTTVLESESEQMMQQLDCIWKSLVMTVGELPENTIRRDLFNELLELISLYVQDCQHNSKLVGVVMNILIKSLFEDNSKIMSLLVTKMIGPMYTILPILSNSFVENFYGGKTVDELLLFFKPVTTFMMHDVLCCPNRITTWLLKRLPANDYTLVMWMALVDAACESNYDLAAETLGSILSYPIQNLKNYSNEKAAVAAYKWFTAYSIFGPRLANVNVDSECLISILQQTNQDCLAAKIFMFHVSLTVLKQKLMQKIDNDCENVTQIFLGSMSSIITYSSIEKVFPALIDTLLFMGSKLKDSINVSLAKLFVSVLKLTMKLLLQQTVNDTTIIFVEKMLLSLLDILKVKDYEDLAFIINDEILACSSIAKKHASKIKSSLSMLTLHLNNNKNKNLLELNEPKSDTVNNKLTGSDENMKKVSEDINNAKEGFNAPSANYCMKSNKRAASIVNTVVENGEEYVVVKSNWKFNPRNLTENQKEKLKRKREDIPALYQDLSQSQDEFKLRAWKPDSQETSTSSKSASMSNNDNVTTVLNQIANTDVVPRIFENMLADNAKNNVDDKNSGNHVIVNNTLNIQNQTTSTKDLKSPRMALKDRVFRNVRNLVEKSSLPKDVTTSLLTDDINKTLNENSAKTPTNKAKISTNVVNSAPPKIASERPSRVIKKPKKFDDSELISLKKRRQSQDIRPEVLDSETTSSKKKQHPHDSRIDAFDINKIKERQISQDLSIDESEKYCLKTVHESQQSQFSETEKALKNIQQSRNSQSNDAKKLDLKMKEHSGVDAKIRNLNKKQDTQLDPEIITLKDSKQNEPQSDGGEITDLITKQQFKVSRAETPKINNLKKRRQSQDSQSVIPETITLIDDKQLQESQPNASKTGSLKNRPKSLDSRSDSTKINSLKKRRQSRDTAFDNSDGGEITDLIPKQQFKVSQAETLKINNLKKRRQSQDSQSVIPETITLTDDEQLQESRPNASKTDSLKNRRKSLDLRSDSTKINSLKKGRQPRDTPFVNFEITTSKDSQQVQESRSDDGEITDFVTKPQVSRSDTAKISNLRKRRQSHDSPLINSSELQSHSIDVVVPSYVELREKDNVVQIECDKDLSDTNKDEFTGDKKQSLLKEQSHKNLPLQDLSHDSQCDDQVFNNAPVQDISLNSQPKGQSPKTVSIQDTLPDSQPHSPFINNIPLQDTLPESQIQEHSSVIMQDDKEHITGDNNGYSETPTLKAIDKDHEEKSAKKKESRIVKQLLIDMVEGHPLLQAQPNSEGNTPKRATRKSLVQTTNNNNRRQALSEKLEKFKSDLQIVPLQKNATKTTKKLKDKTSLSPIKTVTMLKESLEKQLDERTSFSSDDQPMSEDIIESSQYSTINTISVKSTKSILKKQPVVILDILKTSALATSQDTLNDEIISLTDTLSSDAENKEDTQFPKNINIEKSELDLTENMETQPVSTVSFDTVTFQDTESCGDVIFVTNDQQPIIINTHDTFQELNTQETAEADTEPMDVTVEKTRNSKNTQEDTTKTISETIESLEPVDQNYSPSKDEPERKQDFLNNTQEISPIKTLSPLREKQSPSPETSSDYVVIKLTSPVHTNGEPYEKCDSPEIFTEDKISPDKRNESPPRIEVLVNNTSPSSSLSLKKNRPQRRAGGRAAQMLDLCAIMNNDTSADPTDNRRAPSVHTPAKRNLKSLYNSTVANVRENTDIEPESAEREQFLEFKKSVPTASSSPVGPILKRKFIEISDEPTPSPANKRKRVSFHDPPVSTTVAVQKYIEPGAIRSPQHSTIKRRDRTLRNHTAMKSPKRLESVFRLENVLSKAVESFTEDSVVAAMEDTEMSSMEDTPTPAIEVVKTSDLNDTDPICPALLRCNDPIENVAAELSSPAMKSLFIKEIEGKVGTIADLAKMTELEINRLCIKAPKVQVARNVLLEYAFNKVNPKLDSQDDLSVTTQKQVGNVYVDAEIQTSKSECSDSEMQTDATPVAFNQTQTDCMPVANTSVQTNESGYTSTKDVIASCLSERPDFIAQLSKCLEVSSVHMIADNALSFNAVLELLSKRMTIPNSVEVTNKVLEVQSKSNLSCNSLTQNKLSFVQKYLFNHFDSKDLILFCSQLLQKIYENPT